MTDRRDGGRLVRVAAAVGLDFFSMSDRGKAQFILLALSQGQSFQLTTRNPQGGQDAVTCDTEHCPIVRRLFDESIVPSWQEDGGTYLSVRERGIEPSGARPNLLFFSDPDGQVRPLEEEREGEWGCIHIAEQQLMPAFCHQLLGTSRGEGILMGELCFGLEEGTTWALFRDREGGLCGTPVTTHGFFREVMVDLQRSLADDDGEQACGDEPLG
ncbi:MAG: hypothetical protein ACK55X_04130 [Synechococcaceae cyanobacterium]|jgi:hypothetical protein